MAETCSLLSVRKSSAYCAVFTTAQAPSPQHALDGLEYATRLEGLDDKVLRACLNGLHHERLLSHGAAHQHSRGRIILRDLPNGIDATHVGHHDVHGHEVGAQLLVLLHCLDAGLRFADDLESRLLQDVADHSAHEDGVVADE